MTESIASPLTGKCTCEQVHYQLRALPLFVHCCHCRWCQRQSGAAFALNAIIEASHFELKRGDLEVIEVPTSSGRGQKIARCSRCRIAIYSNYGGAGDQLHFVRVGSLDNPDLITPDIHIYTASKQPWVALTDGAPQVDEYYKMTDYWPVASIERLKAIKGG